MQSDLEQDEGFLTDPVQHFKHGLLSLDMYDKYRPTVSCIVINSGRVLLVQSGKQAEDERRRSWVPPQGLILRGITLVESIAHTLSAELGQSFSPACLPEFGSKSFDVLGAYENPARGGGQPKYIVVVGLVLHKLNRVQLGQDNVDHKFVRGQYDLWNLMADTRPTKVSGTCHAINAAQERGMLDWHCDDVINHYADAA